MSNPIEPRLLTADLPGIGGTIKQHVVDFEVEEIPAYEPSGQGEHLFLSPLDDVNLAAQRLRPSVTPSGVLAVLAMSGLRLALPRVFCDSLPREAFGVRSSSAPLSERGSWGG